MKSIVYGAITALLTGVHLAATADVAINCSWVAPAVRINGDAIAAEELAGYEVQAVGAGWSQISRINSGKVTATNIALPGAGAYTLVIRAIDTAGTPSAWSAPASVVVGTTPDEQLAELQAKYAALQKQVIKNGLDLLACRAATKK